MRSAGGKLSGGQFSAKRRNGCPVSRDNVDTLKELGWTLLPFRFSSPQLDALSKLNPHIGRGCRLPDMQDLEASLPNQFKANLAALGFQTTPNRAIGFVKSKQSNWSLPWHQDRVIAMEEKIESPEFSNWTQKSGTWHCEPNERQLRRMAFAYIAFDDIKDGLGGLEIAEGTHQHGKISNDAIEARIETANLVVPNMNAGDVLFVSALILHRSGLWDGEGKRKSFRIDFIRSIDDH